VTAVIVVPFTTLTLVAATVSNLTVAPDKKLVPVMLTEVPPAVLPLCGVIALTVGAGLAGCAVLVKVKPFDPTRDAL
jgi:hypothetical protein